MYRTCIFCSAKLGSNDSIERFPVGKMLAFDAAKGRLWAVCPKCARWNLSPIEERWEVIEDAEKLFRDARLRGQSENIGIAKLRDGTRLIRIGAALPSELALWRYGDQLGRRAASYRWQSELSAAALRLPGIRPRSRALDVIGAAVNAIAGMVTEPIGSAVLTLAGRKAGNRVIHAGPEGVARTRNMIGAYLEPGAGGGLVLNLPAENRTWIRLHGDAARSALARGVAGLNVRGAEPREVNAALSVLDAARGTSPLLDDLAARRMAFWSAGWNLDLYGWDMDHMTAWYWVERARRHGISNDRFFTWEIQARMETVSFGDYHTRATGIALEMALHEETERRAMEGELAALEAMWREAEQLAAIADRLPDVPASDPPRLGG